MGLLECLLSYTIALWYNMCRSPPNTEASADSEVVQREEVLLPAIWIKFGNYDSQFDASGITATANTAPSIYFVTLVVM